MPTGLTLKPAGTASRSTSACTNRKMAVVPGDAKTLTENKHLSLKLYYIYHEKPQNKRVCPTYFEKVVTILLF